MDSLGAVIGPLLALALLAAGLSLRQVIAVAVVPALLTMAALRRVRAGAPARAHLLLIGSGINFVDVAGAELLVREAQAQQDRGGALYLCNLKPAVMRPWVMLFACSPLERTASTRVHSWVPLTGVE